MLKYLTILIYIILAINSKRNVKKINFKTELNQLKQQISQKEKQMESYIKQVDFYIKNIIYSYLIKIATTYLRVSYHTYDFLYIKLGNIFY